MRSDLTPRVALFADSYFEVNGAAMTCRKLTSYARENNKTMICVAGDSVSSEKCEGSLTVFSIGRSSLSISMDQGLAFDPLFLRHYRNVAARITEFKPDVIHITGLNDISILGAYIAHKNKIPLIASWHTNLHEFASRRIANLFSSLPENLVQKVSRFVEARILSGALLYYKMPKIILAPNAELQEVITSKTGRLSQPMFRGVDTDIFDPAKRSRDNELFTIGFVGRLQAEKNIQKLVEIEKALMADARKFQFLIVGDGTERENLEKEMSNAIFTGFLEGDELSRAYANMDVFVFPSETDAFGNVIQEAQASGVPTIVSSKGGPKFIVCEGETGFVADSASDIADRIATLMDDDRLLAKMSSASRSVSLTRSWDSVFRGVYTSYDDCIKIAERDRLQKLAAAAKDNTDTFSSVTRDLLRDPIRNILMRWNWKTAFLSASMRSSIFFAVYIQQRQGLSLAFGAVLIQFLLRGFLGGISGSIIQSYSQIQPIWHSLVIVPAVVLLLTHGLEFVVQGTYDSFTHATAGNGAVLVSLLVSLLSILFNLFAMRRGALLAWTDNQASLWNDIRRLPGLALEFIFFPFLWVLRRQ